MSSPAGEWVESATGAVPGRRLVVGIDGRSARVVETGEPSEERHTFVLLNGCGLSLEHWGLLVQALSGEQGGPRHVLRLDEPGIGGTPWPGGLPRLVDRVAFVAATIRSCAPGPVIVVGHSMAAFAVEALVRLHPDLVDGYVIVDGSVARRAFDPGLALRWAPAFVHRVTRWRPAARVARWIYVRSLETWIDSGLDPRDRAAIEHWFVQPDALAAAVAEWVAFQPQADALRSLRRRVDVPTDGAGGVVPGVVLTATEDGSPLARLLGAEHVEDDRSGHLVMHDHPESVLEAIARVEEVLGR